MNTANTKNLTQYEQKACSGELLTRDELLELSEAPLNALTAAANRIRKVRCGSNFDICSISNIKSGRCPENCAFCAQSSHWQANPAVYPLISVDDAVAQANHDAEAGVHRFSLVASGQRLSAREVEQVALTIAAIKSKVGISVCASLGLLSQDEFATLASAGLERVHNNLETARSFFPHICTTHAYDDKLCAIKAAHAAGLEVCSGGIIGMGESRADRIDLALEIRATQAVSVPLNVLNPIANTPLENTRFLGDDEVLRTVALFRFALPDTSLRLAGGRILLRESGRDCLRAGANALISGDMLTTSGFTIASDRALALEEGFAVCATEPPATKAPFAEA